MSQCDYGCHDGLVSVAFPGGGGEQLHQCRCPLGKKWETIDFRNDREKKAGLPPQYLRIVPERQVPQGRALAAGRDE